MDTRFILNIIIHLCVTTSYFLLVSVDAKHVDISTSSRLFVLLNFTDCEHIHLKDNNLTLLEQVVGCLYIFDYGGYQPPDEDYLKHIQDNLENQVIKIEAIKVYSTLIDQQLLTAKVIRSVLPRGSTRTSSGHYGMGVEDAWDRGYTGEGVVIASVDVGVDDNIPDLYPNINHDLSWNFVESNSNIQPDRLHSYPNTWHLSDHGNLCSGLIAALRNNNLCSCGIAYNARIAALKVFTMEEKFMKQTQRLSTEHITKALSYEPNHVDIYSCSWAIEVPFEPLTFSSKFVLQNGIEKGRKGKGSIYVFPVSHIAEGYSNSKYTITINSLGPHGSISKVTGELNACVLTSTFGEGSSIMATEMNTTTFHANHCTDTFKGTSASTAMISAIISLALQANPSMSWRDVQHLLVEASDFHGLQVANECKKNGAAKLYHSRLGFGSLNADKLVQLATVWENVPKDVTHTKTSTHYLGSFRRPHKRHGNIHISYSYIEMQCDNNTTDSVKRCINRVEHANVIVTYNTSSEANTELALKSPSGTLSILMDRGQSHERNMTRDNAEFLSVHFWGEQMNGTWFLILKTTYADADKNKTFGISSFTLSVSGDALPDRETDKVKQAGNSSPSNTNIDDRDDEHHDYSPNDIRTTTKAKTSGHTYNKSSFVVIVVMFVINNVVSYCKL